MAGSHAARMGPADHVDVRIFAKSQYNPKICESRHHKRGSTMPSPNDLRDPLSGQNDPSTIWS